MDIIELKREYEARIADLNNRISDLESLLERYNHENKTLREDRDRYRKKVRRGREILTGIQKLGDIYLHDELILPKIEFERKINNTTIKSNLLNDVLPKQEATLSFYLEDLDFGVGVANRLKRAGVNTVRELLEKFKNKNELCSNRYLGSRCGDEIIKVLAEKGVDVTQYMDGE